MDNYHPNGANSPPVPVPPVALAVASSHSSRSSRHSLSTHSRRSLKSLDRLLGDDRDPKKLQKLVHKLYEQLRFEKDRADHADRRASEAVSYLKSICEEKLRALREISRLEEELKLYKIQYDEAQKEIFRAQAVLEEVDEKRFHAEKEAADARSAVRKMRDEINVMRAQEEGRREGLQEGFKRGREMGYQEGLRMARAEVEGTVQPHTHSQQSAGETPRSRMRTNQPPEAQTQHRHSRVPSNFPSRPPTVPPETPTSPSVPRETSIRSHPVQPTSEVPEEPETIRPRSFRGPSPSPQMPISAIPPDNLIPRLDEDNRIRIPPPFEFNRASSPLPGPSENEEPKMIPPPISTNIRVAHGRRSASPASASTTLSQMDMITDPYYIAGRTPMSAIPESLSQEGSPEAHDAATLRKQPSLTAQSAKLMASGLTEPIYTRPRTVSGGSSISVQSPPVIPEANLRASVSTASTTPGITVQAPSIPGSAGTDTASYSRAGAIYGNPNADVSDSSFLPPIPEAHSRPLSPVRLSGIQHQLGAGSPMFILRQMPDEWGQGPENISGDSMNPPVIPHPDLYTNPDEEEDAVSSGMESMESLTTPPVKQQKLPSRAGSVRSTGGSALSRRTDPATVSRTGSAMGAMAGTSGSAFGTIPDTRWDDVVRSAHRPPIGFPLGPFDPPSVAGNNSSATKTPSNKGKGRTLSMSTSRSGQ